MISVRPMIWMALHILFDNCEPPRPDSDHLLSTLAVTKNSDESFFLLADGWNKALITLAFLCIGTRIFFTIASPLMSLPIIRVP